MVFLGLQASSFNSNNCLYAFTHFNFSLISPQETSPKIKVVSQCVFLNCNLVLLLESLLLPLGVAFQLMSFNPNVQMFRKSCHNHLGLLKLMKGIMSVYVVYVYAEFEES
ncbi:hypothetical protein XENOCAPTIV_000409 [Xenoophorus captivus]|uniref:Uncharacterized protein n=1 Tax=Xenoophorus captivus TaxID=1517983 RepID=A0ABV0QGI3_9TELE